MRVLYIVNALANSKNPSVEPFVRAQINSLKQKGVKADVYNINGAKSKTNYLKALFDITYKINLDEYDIVHGHYVYAGLVARFQRRKPAIVSFMGSDLNGSLTNSGKISLRGRFDILLSKILQNSIDGIIVKSKGMMQNIVAKEKSTVIPNGVDFKIFDITNKDKARQKLGLSNKMKYVLFVGKFKSENKGYAVAKEAVRILNKGTDQYELLLVSDLPQIEIPTFMNAADVLVLPSRKEGSPNVVKEALACNLPVVATDVGDVREIMSGLTGCQIVDRTPEAFARGIGDMCYSDIQFSSRAHISYLRSEKIADSIVDFYKSIICNKRRKI